MSVKLIGVVNVTPDSFSDGGKFFNPGLAVLQAEAMLERGADIVDIGAEATNPWAKAITVEEEWRRLEPILQVLLPRYGGDGDRISIDTRHPEIVERAAQYGKFMVNDVTTFIDPAMIAVTAKHNLYAIASHLPLAAQGDIQRAHTAYKFEDSSQIRDELLSQKAKMISGGIAPANIILDPGIGFGKSMQLNWQLLRFAQLVPTDAVLIGYSRKRFLATDPATGELLPSADRYDPNVNVAAAKLAVDSGACYLRVHDVAVHQQLLHSLVN